MIMKRGKKNGTGCISTPQMKIWPFQALIAQRSFYWLISLTHPLVKCTNWFQSFHKAGNLSFSAKTRLQIQKKISEHLEGLINTKDICLYVLIQSSCQNKMLAVHISANHRCVGSVHFIRTILMFQSDIIFLIGGWDIFQSCLCGQNGVFSKP